LSKKLRKDERFPIPEGQLQQKRPYRDPPYGRGLVAFRARLLADVCRVNAGTVHLPFYRIEVPQTDVDLTGITEEVFIEVDTAPTYGGDPTATIRSDLTIPSNTDRFVYWSLRRYEKLTPTIFRQIKIHWEGGDAHLETVLA